MSSNGKDGCSRIHKTRCEDFMNVVKDIEARYTGPTAPGRSGLIQRGLSKGLPRFSNAQLQIRELVCNSWQASISPSCFVRSKFSKPNRLKIGDHDLYLKPKVENHSRRFTIIKWGSPRVTSACLSQAAPETAEDLHSTPAMERRQENPFVQRPVHLTGNIRVAYNC